MLLLIGLLSSVPLQNLWSTLTMTSAQVVEASISTTDTSPSQDYPYLEDQTWGGGGGREGVGWFSSLSVFYRDQRKLSVKDGEGGGWGVLEYYTATELQSLLGDQVSFIVNQHSSEQGRVGWFSSPSVFNRDQRKLSVKDGEGRGGGGHWNTTQLHSLIGGQVSFIVNQHSSDLPFPPCDLNFKSQW